MKKNNSRSAFSIGRVLTGFAFCFVGVALAVYAFKTQSAPERDTMLLRDMPTLGDDPTNEARDLSRLEQFWNDRLTYPTGVFNPAWVRAAAAQHQSIPTALPAGNFDRLNSAKRLSGLQALGGAPVPLSLNTSAFTALGPSPEIMTGCTGCFDYTKTQARVNAIVIDPTTTTPGSITAYIGSVGGGVWKTTNCCTVSTTWTILTDDPLIGTTAIDALALDPNNPNTIYAGTGDLNFGSFSMGSQGILKSTNGGASWTILGADIFGPAYSEPSGNYPQYAAVGKVKVDPNNSNNIAAGTKTGLYLSHNGGSTWTQCATNAFSTQRQDITGLELSDMGGGVTRIIAAVGTRGFPTYIQYDLGQNGANGIYSANMTNSGCPTFSSIARNDNGFVFGTQVTGSPYTTGALMNAGSGTPCNYPITGGTGVCASNTDQLGRIDIAVAPSNPNYIYAQVQSIEWNNNSQCGNTNGCQLGVWVSTDGGTTWTFMTGSAGGSLPACGQGDYPQNWYDQGIAVDPNDPTRVFIDTFDTWFATSSGTAFFDITCGYNGGSAANHVVHVDHHALAFVPGSSSILLEGSDGGIFATTNADTTNSTTRPTWINMDTNLNTLEFYAGDISANFANDSAPSAVGGAQDNGPSSVLFAGSPTGPVSWQMGLGGDGFSGQIDSSGSTTTQASGTITVSGVGTAGQQFVVGSQTFTWAATRTTTGEVAVGTSATSAATNLNNAINADVPPSVVTATRSGTTVTIRATMPGAGGNAIPFANISSTNTTFNPSTGTLANGGNAGTSNRIYYEGNNSGGLSRCLTACTSGGASWSSIKGGWGSDTQSFVLPVNLFKGGIPGGDSCTAGCGHMLAASTRVFETITANVPSGGTVQWYNTNSAACVAGNPCLTKGSIGNRSYINQVKYSPKYQSVAIVGTNDGNVQIGFNLGTGVANQANWVNVTGGNLVLPNRPIQGIALDPSASAANLPIGYAAVGGFNANTPTTPGHVFRVTCTSNCGGYTWLNKTGNLPDIPVDAVVVNPNYPQQVFAGTDFGLYFTNDITQASPTWYRFEAGLPHVMIWDMQIDGGATTLSLWTRGRGAYVYPLPSTDISISALSLVASSSRLTHGAAGTFDVDLTSGDGVECRSGGPNNDYTVVFKFTNIISGVDGMATSCGSVSGSEIGADEHEFLVHLTGVNCNAQNVTVNLAGIHDTSNQTLGSANAIMGLLLGDTTGNRVVNSSDISQVQGQSGQAVGPTNFREDVTTSGDINSSDITLVQQQSGTGLPPAPPAPPSASATPASGTSITTKKKSRKAPELKQNR